MNIRPTTRTFEGEPCPRCNSTLYYNSTKGCIECLRARNAARARTEVPLMPPCDYNVWVSGVWRVCQAPATMLLDGRALCRTHHREEVEGVARLTRRKADLQANREVRK